MPELTPKEFAGLIRKWQTERPESAVWPRISGNPREKVGPDEDLVPTIHHPHLLLAP